MNRWDTDCLVIGSGVAGLVSAIELAERNYQVTVVSAAPKIEESNTLYAQGGIIYEAAAGDPDKLISDVLEAGCGMSYLPAVRQLATLGPERVRELLLEKANISFAKNAHGGWDLTKEAAHSENRILHDGDESGRAIESGLLAYCQRASNIKLVPRTTAVNLLMTSFHSKDRSKLHEPARCFGAFVFDQEKEEMVPVFSKHTVLATGGVGQLYLHNTNSRFARGDGVALAHRAGCRLENLEYIQFHPTTFFKRGAPRFLVSEALRGEGAVLVNSQGERFLQKRLKGYKIPELAPRDRVAQAIHHELLESEGDCIYLDISHRESDWIKERFPFLYQSCLAFGIDMTKEAVPVVPGAHYSCGGVWSDLDGRTSTRHLWVVGEAACTGVHGANRLASTSLLESLVWSSQAGRAIANQLKGEDELSRPDVYPWHGGKVQVDPGFLQQDWMTLKHTMWNYVGLIKTDARLNRAKGILGELSRGIEVFYQQAALSDELVGLRHAALVCQLVVNSALKNTKSKGCYLREELEI